MSGPRSPRLQLLAAVAYVVLTPTLFLWSDGTNAPVFGEPMFIALLLGIAVPTGYLVMAKWALVLPGAVSLAFLAKGAATGTGTGDSSFIAVVIVLGAIAGVGVLGVAAGLAFARRQRRALGLR